MAPRPANTIDRSVRRRCGQSLPLLQQLVLNCYRPIVRNTSSVTVTSRSCFIKTDVRVRCGSLTSPHCSASQCAGQRCSRQRRLVLGVLPRQRVGSTTRCCPAASCSTQRTVLERCPARPHVLLHDVHSPTVHLPTHTQTPGRVAPTLYNYSIPIRAKKVSIRSDSILATESIFLIRFDSAIP